MKKGFTLIELLAVIVILAIIALIATPLVLKYIEKSRKESKVDSAYSFVRNLETEIANYSIKNKGTKYNGQPNAQGYYDLDSFKNSEIDTTVKGDKLEGVKVCLSSLGQVEKAILKYGKYYISYDGKKGSVSDEAKYSNFSCSGNSYNEPITEEAGLYDSNNNLLYSWDELVNDYGINVEFDYLDSDMCLTVDDSQLPGVKLASNEELKRGTKLVIGNSVTKLGTGALYVSVDDVTSNLVEIVIPNSVTSIGNGALGMNLNLTKVKLSENLTTIPSRLFMGCSKVQDVEIPESVTSIELAAFAATGITSITIPDSVTSIGMGAFGQCKNLETLILSKNLINIEESAFVGCEKLKSVVIPSSLTTISGGVFSDCIGLENVVIPKSVTTIERYAFSNCEKLLNINYTGTEAEWNLITFGDRWNDGLPQDNKVNYNYTIESW